MRWSWVGRVTREGSLQRERIVGERRKDERQCDHIKYGASLKPPQVTWAPGASHGFVGCYLGSWKLWLGDYTSDMMDLTEKSRPTYRHIIRND